jgi:hypothetical protein
MIPKSGNRFSEKIMLKKNVLMARAAGGVLMALMLMGCAGGQFGGAAPEAAQTPDGMAGRWMLSAPNAPACGMNFGGAPGAREGSVAPEGGCPEKFFMSRRWVFEQDKLTINDHENNPLAQLNSAGTRFEGQSSAGTPVTLTRATPAG